MYKFICYACGKNFSTKVINSSKCMLCGSKRVERVGVEVEK